MSYIVYQDGRRCKDYNLKSWENDSFECLEEAVLFMFMWAYPYNLDQCKQAVDFYFGIGLKSFEVGREYNLSTCEHPVYMQIKEI